ncbi:MAG TPA: hypothetical protein DD435_16640 [Cyanobacteria bacterium UBA8530]|nr:hypothetical protein [Cyanobacteria bacterium UBA8530]
MINKWNRTLGVLALSLTLMALVGCPAKNGNPLNPAGSVLTYKVGIISNNSAKLGGQVMGPSGIISNNSAKIISNNSAKYRTSAYDVKGVDNAIVYLTSPDEEFYTDTDGKVLFAVTDANGNYHFDKAPGGVPVIVTVVGANDRRLVGFRKPLKDNRQTEQKIDVSLATTFMTELLRSQAKDQGLSMGDFFSEPKLSHIVDLTQTLLDEGKLGTIDVEKGLPDLAIRNIPKLRNDYLMAFATQKDSELSLAWSDLLKQKFLIVTSIPTGLNGGNGVSVTTDDAGNIYYSATSDTGASIVRIAPTGASFDLLGGTTDNTRWLNRSLLFGNSPWWGINYPRGLTYYNNELYFCDLNNAFLAKIPNPKSSDQVTPPDWSGDELPESFYNSSFTEAVPNPLDDLVWEGATYSWLNFNKVCSLGEYYKSADDFRTLEKLPLFGLADFAIADDSIYLCDSKKNVILEYDRNSKAYSVLAGKSGQRGFSGDGGPADQALLNGPYDIALQNGALYFTDISNQRIRKIDLSTKLISTVVGNSNPADKVGDVLKGGYAGDGGPATSALLAYPHKFLFDADGNMFLSDSDNQRIRKVDKNGVITTIAGMDPLDPNAVSGDGLAKWVTLGEIQGLALDKDGNLLMADARTGALRKLWLSNLK